MAVSRDTAQDLTRELYLMGRAIRVAIAHPEEGQLLPGGIGVLVVLEGAGLIRQVDLASHLCISPSALSRHVTDLVAEGYVTRQADPHDGRATLLQVTDAGHDLLRRIRISRAKRMQEALADWDEAEAAQACAAIEKLRNALVARVQHTMTADRPVQLESQGVDV
ncbi:MarR family winged helix-turn-helix transcriptional regulator [Nocardia cyriacigeorgica]|uniref:DNA-binding transcriptional repressor MarR n=3 Tax=Nocardia cyriacigeorgica TaxID=135487 RepID=A0A4U8VZK4_9NOCA|nr:MarR family transcriptional regulator [Nocardia cyriacigeorgica]MBF6100616.1 MarR family transcriptional regulator [Nocardia cyriacigeorgica]MBF6159035.1 MarR family transcriptional regulator [Nocardia cyriacigeorgica]MBF6197279.1 MarR family transcriptional regulator [Nocardia cyriacigeorgica]MBF6318955.1 MarR family transcriptional regulator [Nocardia cyriacigeorgica]MBF6344274.1 MarR family transcriptional regulator [Nocardia cyriacigeorgica]